MVDRTTLERLIAIYNDIEDLMGDLGEENLLVILKLELARRSLVDVTEAMIEGYI